MVKKFVSLVLISSLSVGLLACVGNNQKEQGGAVIGGVIGGILGNKVGKGKGRVVATAAGAAVGALLGSHIGKKLDKYDRIYASRAQQAALETNRVGQPSTWSNPDSGNSGVVIPTRTIIQKRSGQPCREYQHTVTIGGKTERAYGRACREADGSWKIIN